MFDSVLHERKSARQRALGGTVSVLVHVAIIGGIIWYSTHKPKADETPKGVPVAFVTAPKTATAAPPPPPPPPKRKTTPKTPVIKKDLVIPKEIPKEKPPEKPPEPDAKDDSSDDDQDDGVEGGVEGGVKGGVVGGVVGGQLGGQLGGGGDQPVFFGEGMTKPTIDPNESQSFRWTRAQLDQRVEGLILVNCVVTKEGTLKDCKILKRIPQIEDAQVMEYLNGLRLKPATQGGKPLSIKSFTIPIRLKVP